MEQLKCYEFKSDEDEIYILAYGANSAINILNKENQMGLNDYLRDIGNVTITLLTDKQLEEHFVSLNEDDNLFEPINEDEDDGRNDWTFKAYIAHQTKEMLLCTNVPE